MALAWPIDAIGPMEPGIEPLRRIGRRHLTRQHEAQLVEKGGGVRFRVEIFALQTPIGPGAGETVENLAGRGLAPIAQGLWQGRERFFVGGGAPQESGDANFRQAASAGRARRRGGNIFARARPLRPGSKRREPRCFQPRKRSNRRDRGFRFWLSGTRFPRRGSARAWCNAVRFALVVPLKAESHQI